MIHKNIDLIQETTPYLIEIQSETKAWDWYDVT